MVASIDSCHAFIRDGADTCKYASSSLSLKRLKKYDQVFNYLGYVLYLSRRTASHDLIAFGEHKFLMEFAVIKGFPPAKKKELRDPYEVAARNSIYAYGDNGGSRKGATRAPRQDRPREGKAKSTGKTARKRARGSLPAARMASAALPVNKLFQGKCLNCGANNHSASGCPAAAADRDGSATAEQKRMRRFCQCRCKEKGREKREKFTHRRDRERERERERYESGGRRSRSRGRRSWSGGRGSWSGN